MFVYLKESNVANWVLKLGVVQTWRIVAAAQINPQYSRGGASVHPI